MTLLTALAILIIAAAAFLLGRAKASALAGDNYAQLHSRPNYHGLYSLMWVLIAGLGALIVVSGLAGAVIDSTMTSRASALTGEALSQIQLDLMLNDARAIATGGIPSSVDPAREALAEYYTAAGFWRGVAVLIAGVGAALAALLRTRSQISMEWRARNRSERVIRAVLAVSATIAILTTVGIVLSLIGETLIFFNRIDWRLFDYFFGTTWSPLAGVFEGKLDPEKVGAIPLFAGTAMITVIAMLVAVPIGLMAAIYLSDFASPKVRAWTKPLLEVLAGIPTVVYGFFAAITVAPFIRDNGGVIVPILGLLAAVIVGFLALLLLERARPGFRQSLTRQAGGYGLVAYFAVFALGGLAVIWSANPGFTFDVASESALAAGVVMGIMIIPFISSLSDDVINAVPQSLRDGSYGLGATKAETIRQVILPAALPGIVSAVLLGVSRAVGETMIVVMAAGQGANLTWNPMETVTTVTVQIVALITGDTEADTAAAPAFALGFTLFFITLALNIYALRIVRKYRELYD